MKNIFLNKNVFADVYRKLLSDRKYGLSITVMATHIMPSLIPQTVNPALNLEQYLVLHEVSTMAFNYSFLFCNIFYPVGITGNVGPDRSAPTK